MSTNEPFSRLMGINQDFLSKRENLLLELDLLVRLSEELNEFFKNEQKDYIYMTFNTKMESATLEAQLLYLIIRDILATKEYSPEGIARYADTHEDVIQEVFFGRNIVPSATLFRKIIELHRTIRRELYESIIKKIVFQYLVVANVT